MPDDWRVSTRRGLAQQNRRITFGKIVDDQGSQKAQEMQLLIPIAQASPVTSTTVLPANALVTRAAIQVNVAYSGGTTITVGQTGSASLLMSSGDSNPTLAVVAPYNLFDAPQTTAWGSSALPVLITIAGGPAAGSGNVLVEYSVPGS